MIQRIVSKYTVRRRRYLTRTLLEVECAPVIRPACRFRSGLPGGFAAAGCCPPFRMPGCSRSGGSANVYAASAVFPLAAGSSCLLVSVVARIEWLEGLYKKYAP